MKSTLLLAALLLSAGRPDERKPNVVIILTDDQGYADVSFNPNHPKEVDTPNVDALARSGVICSAGYTTGHVCSPTRAGLMTGRYQQRFGIYSAGEGGSGMPLDEILLPKYLKPAGYVSGAFGKWHLGVDMKYNAVNRGFDEFYGFMGRGAHDYFKLDDPKNPIYRNLEPIRDKGYLTTRITDEAVSFIRRHREKPYLLYVAYNAVHSPAQAPEEDVKKFDTGEKTRDTLLAMLRHLDAGVGRIVSELKKTGTFDNTLLFYLSDNGGSKVMHANNAPLRGYKQQDYEGGIRVPFIVSWPDKLKGGTTCKVPVSSIDLLPTTLAAAGVPLPERRIFDGKNMLPALRGEIDRLHERLFWSSGDDGKWAIRSGRWKLVGIRDRVELFDLREDLAEAYDVSKRHPDVVGKLKKLHSDWLDEMAEPMKGLGKRWTPEIEKKLKERSAKKRKRQKQ